MPNLVVPTGVSLDSTTVVASDILSGKTAYDGEGNLLTGTMTNNGRWPNADKVTFEQSKIWMYKSSGYTEGGLSANGSTFGNASVSDVRSGVTFTSQNGLNLTGTFVGFSGSGIYASFSTCSGYGGISQLLVSDPNWLSTSNSSSCTFKKSGNVHIIGYGTVPQYTAFSISCAGQTLCSCQGTDDAASTSCNKTIYVSAGQSLTVSLGWSNYGGWCRCAITIA